MEENPHSLKALQAMISSFQKRLLELSSAEIGEFIAKASTCLLEMKVHPEDSCGLHQAGLDLWNCCLASKQITDNHLDCQLKHLACNLLALIPAAQQDAELLMTLLKFFARTGAQLWKQASNSHLAEECWDSALKYAQQLDATSPNELLREEIDQVKFSIFIWKAEALINKNQFGSDLLSLVTSARASTWSNSQASHLTFLVYSVAFALHEQKNFTDSSQWATLELEIRDEFKVNDKVKEGQSLRLLASCFLQLNQMEKASNCARLAILSHPHPYATFLLATIAMRSDPTQVMPRIMELLDDKGCSVDLALMTLREAATHEKNEEALKGYDILISKYSAPDTHAELEKIRFRRLEFLFHYASDQASAFLECIISDHHRSNFKMSIEGLKQVCNFLWNLGTEAFQRKDYNMAINWYKNTLSLISPADKERRLDCLNIIAQCYLSHGDIHNASEYATQSRNLDPNTVLGHYLLFKIHLEQEKEDLVLEDLHRISEGSDCLEYLEVCSQLAYKKGKEKITLQTLKCLLLSEINTLTDNPSKYTKRGHIARILRSVIKLLLQLEEPAEQASSDITAQILQYTQMGISTMLQSSIETVFASDVSEIDWLATVAWNKAVATTDMGSHGPSSAFFEAFLTLNQHLPPSTSNLGLRVKALALTASSLLHSEDPNPELILKKLEECKLLLPRLNQPTDTDVMEMEREASQLEISLVQMEFETKCRLYQPDIEQLDKQLDALNLKGTSHASILAACALLVYKSDPKNREVCLELLRRSRLLYAFHGDFGKCSETNRLMVKISASREASLPAFQFMLQLLETTDASLLPSKELRWLIVNAFNNGIYYFHRGEQMPAAEQWLACSIKLLSYDEASTTDYQPQIVKAYNSVLSSLGQAIDQEE